MAQRSGPSTIGEVLSKSASLTRARRIDWWTWRDLVGARVASRSQPLRTDGATLLVTVKSAIWAQELSLLSQPILQGLNQRGHRIENLRFVVGEVNLPRRARAKRARSARPLPAALEQRLGAIDDPRLRDALRRAASLTLKPG